MASFPSRLNRLLAELVSCPSVGPEGEAGGTVRGEAALGKLVAGYLRALGADVTVIPLAAGRPNVMGVFDPPGGRPEATVVFAPHLDTVGVGGMTVPPFQLTASRGRLHGRGACDTKGPMAAVLWALRQWTRSPAARKSRVRWVFLATAGEEAGSLGAQFLVAGGHMKADFAIALEPTDLKVVHAAKGIVRLWLETEGRAAHGATPEKGDNAIYRMLPVALALRDQLAPAFAARRHPVLGGASLNLGIIEGGRGLNLVPDRCRVGLDLRIHPRFTAAQAKKAVERVCRSAGRSRCTVSVHREAPSFVTDKADPWARALRRSARGWASADWFCDANLFASAGIPSVAFGPGSIAQAHTKDEYIVERELAAGAAAFLRFIQAGAGTASLISTVSM